MDREYKLGVDLHQSDNVMDNITFDDLILMEQNINPSSGKTLRDEFVKLIEEKTEEALDMFDRNYEEIMIAAYPDERIEEKTYKLSSEQIEKLAYEIRDFLLEKEIWTDICIYFNNKRLTTHDSISGKYFYNDKTFVEENINPLDYFEYATGCLSMSFEGDFYEVLNGYYGCNIEKEFSELLSKYGLYYELGNAWNLTCCDM